MRLFLLTVLLAAALTGAGCAATYCGGAATSSRSARSRDASASLPYTNVTIDGVPQSGTAVLSLHVEPIAASANETISAVVTYSNASTQSALIRANYGHFYNIRVTSSDGTGVFDTADPSEHVGAFGSMSQEVLGPGKKMWKAIPFRLKTLGTYSVVAYDPDGIGKGASPFQRLAATVTPPVEVTVSP